MKMKKKSADTPRTLGVGVRKAAPSARLVAFHNSITFLNVV